MNISTLPKDKKIAVAQVMLDLNYSVNDIAKELNINRSTVYRYGEKEVPEDLRQFATEIKTIFSIKQHQILAKLLQRIEFVASRSNDLKALITAYKIVSEQTKSLYEIHREKVKQEKWDR